jgi:rare lipoprotein A (peptidoglycan hydrolase)
MPRINGRYYINPAYGRALERARAAGDPPDRQEPLGDSDTHWVTIDGRHVLIPERQGSQPSPKPKQYRGDATYYNLPGKRTASGAKFDPDKMTAAMTAEKAKLGQTVTVTYTGTDEKGNTVTRSISVVVNDRGPFARDANGKAATPLQPAPGHVIDLTPAAFKKLVGSTRPGHVPVTVTVPNE